MADLTQAISDMRTKEARAPENGDLHAVDGTTGNIDQVGRLNPRPSDVDLGERLDLGEDRHGGAVATSES